MGSHRSVRAGDGGAAYQGGSSGTGASAAVHQWHVHPNRPQPTVPTQWRVLRVRLYGSGFTGRCGFWRAAPLQTSYRWCAGNRSTTTATNSNRLMVSMSSVHSDKFSFVTTVDLRPCSGLSFFCAFVSPPPAHGFSLLMMLACLMIASFCSSVVILIGRRWSGCGFSSWLAST